jgi:DNA polymerase-3 subunit delta
MHAIDFLARPPERIPPLCVVHGDEPFLQRLCVQAIERALFGPAEPELGPVRFAGDSAELRDVADELSTRSLFGGGPRLVVVDDADKFVTRFRSELEDRAARPSPGVLVLAVRSWPANTRLAKLAATHGLALDASSPQGAALVNWIRLRADRPHALKLARGAADVLAEIAGHDLGLLEQELAKLAVSLADGEEAAPQRVRELVGGWRAQTAWELLDLVLAGAIAPALLLFDRLVSAGEHPLGLIAQFRASLRRLALAARIYAEADRAGRRLTLRVALEQAGIKGFVLAKSEEQLKRLGRDRAGRLPRQMLDADLALKGPASAPDRARAYLERLLIDLARAPIPAR